MLKSPGKEEKMALDSSCQCVLGLGIQTFIFRNTDSNSGWSSCLSITRTPTSHLCVPWCSQPVSWWTLSFTSIDFVGENFESHPITKELESPHNCSPVHRGVCSAHSAGGNQG